MGIKKKTGGKRDKKGRGGTRAKTGLEARAAGPSTWVCISVGEAKPGENFQKKGGAKDQTKGV